MKNYLGIIQRLLQKAPRKKPAARKYFLATSKIRFLHKILSLKKLVPLICPGGARGPLLATRLDYLLQSAARKYWSDFISEQKSAHTNRFSICGNVYDRLDYETHATDRLKLCVIYKYGSNVITSHIKHGGRNDMHIKLTVRWTFQTNNYRCICFITKIIIGLIVSQFMYSLGCRTSGAYYRSC